MKKPTQRECIDAYCERCIGLTEGKWAEVPVVICKDYHCSLWDCSPFNKREVYMLLGIPDKFYTDPREQFNKS